MIEQMCSDAHSITLIKGVLEIKQNSNRIIKLQKRAAQIVLTKHHLNLCLMN